MNDWLILISGVVTAAFLWLVLEAVGLIWAIKWTLQKPEEPKRDDSADWWKDGNPDEE